MGTVRVTNYVLPLDFSYKGWSVHMVDRTPFISGHDLKVGVTISFDADATLDSIILFTAVHIAEQKRNNDPFSRYFNNGKSDNSLFIRVQSELKAKYAPAVQRFKRENKCSDALVFGINGGMLDRFMGSNMSSVEKAVNKVQEYIDNNLGDIKSKFNSYLKSV